MTKAESSVAASFVIPKTNRKRMKIENHIVRLLYGLARLGLGFAENETASLLTQEEKNVSIIFVTALYSKNYVARRVAFASRSVVAWRGVASRRCGKNPVLVITGAIPLQSSVCKSECRNANYVEDRLDTGACIYHRPFRVCAFD